MSELSNDIPFYMRDQDLADDPTLGDESDPKRSALSEIGNPTISKQPDILDPCDGRNFGNFH